MHWDDWGNKLFLKLIREALGGANVFGDLQ